MPDFISAFQSSRSSAPLELTPCKYKSCLSEKDCTSLSQDDHLEKSGRKAETVFQKFTKHSEAATLASYQIAWNIARAKKPYNVGDFVKKCISDVVEILSPENNKLKKILSDV